MRWTQLGDDELVCRLIQRTVPLSTAEFLVERRDDADMAERISVLLDEEVPA